MPKANYEEHKTARIERIKAHAEKTRAEAEKTLEESNTLASMIPLGQPILIGHHSESRHRRDLERINNKTRKGIEGYKKAKNLERRAEAAQSNNSISSDDPQALSKLREKLSNLEANQELYKAINKVTRSKKLDNAGRTAALKELGVNEAIKKGILYTDWVTEGIPAYRLSNNNAEIRRIKKRIENLEKLEAQPIKEPVNIGDVTITDDTDENRIMMFFPGKPDEETRKDLKQNGFRWSPRTGAWMAYRKQWNWQRAINIAKNYAIQTNLETPSRNNKGMSPRK